MKIILQKAIALSGHASRRQAEKLIQAGRVELNGQVAKPGDMADPDKDIIKIRGKKISSQAAEKVYIKLNKPAGYTCTNRRFPGEKNIFELVKSAAKLFAVGRLDKNSRGLVLLTNDGDLAQILAHPKFRHEKTYEAKVSAENENAPQLVDKLLKGVDIGEGDGVVRAQAVKYLQKGRFIITLSEGKKRQIRRMFRRLGFPIVDIKRLSLADLQLGTLPEGRWEYLGEEEIKMLKIGTDKLKK